MLNELKKLRDQIFNDKLLSQHVKVETHHLDYPQFSEPIYQFNLGKMNPESPTLLIVGGVHGLERIGSQLAWSFLKTLIDRLTWDLTIITILEKINIVFLPLLNPYGYIHFKRSNFNSVDLMRNAPVVSEKKTPFLYGGHRISSKLPWYQGKENIIEQENQILINVFKKNALKSKCLISVDLHSGFGLKDRIWFPFSYSTKPFTQIEYMYSFYQIFKKTFPFHIYRFETQSQSYMLNGDIWDFLYLDKFASDLNLEQKNIYLPLTLEMGSWNWVKKNPLQLFKKTGIFNPIKEHRLKRTFRRHQLFFDFILKSLYSYENWSHLNDFQIESFKQKGLSEWYEK